MHSNPIILATLLLQERERHLTHHARVAELLRPADGSPSLPGPLRRGLARAVAGLSRVSADAAVRLDASLAEAIDARSSVH